VEPFKIDFDALPWESPADSVRFKIYREGTKQCRLLEFTSEFVELHWCEKEHVGFVLNGELEVDFRGKLVRYPEGTAICIPAGPDSGHKARAVSPTVRLFLVEDA